MIELTTAASAAIPADAAQCTGRLRIAIVGAGVSGIAMAVKLQLAGYDEFTVFEQSDGPGGTWRDNTYPGCEVDILSHAYSFSFMLYDWSRPYAAQPELLRYCEDVVDHFGLHERFRFNTKVEHAVWVDEAQAYRVLLAGGEEEWFDVVVSALGLLNYPRYPDWPGLDEFENPKFHSARWDHSVDLAGKRVAVVGTGSTATQIVPAIAPDVERLYVYQRQPGWVFPKDNPPYTARQRSRFQRHPLLQRYARHKEFIERQTRKRLRAIHRDDTKEQRAMRQQLEHWIASVIEDPEVVAAITPDYPVGCKRGVIAAGYYESFNRDNVELVPHAVARVTRNTVIDAAGGEREIDVLIMATGFQPTRFLASIEVTGLGGRTIHESWGGSASAFVGLTVPGIPNFFMLYGPNTNGGVSIMSNAERQADAIIYALKAKQRQGATMIDTKPSAMRWFVKWCDRRNAARTASGAGHCTNYYFSEEGRNVTQWPATSRMYWLFTKTVWKAGIDLVRRPVAAA